MILLVDRLSIEKYWGKTVQLGGSRVWTGTPLDQGQLYFLDGYKSMGKPKQLDDPFLRDWLTEQYLAVSTTIEEQHSTWFYGSPGKKSAYKSVMKYWLPISPPDPNIFHYAQQWLIKKFLFMGDSKIDFDFQYVTSQLRMSTSPGYPYIRNQGDIPAFPTKKKMFQYQEGKYAQAEYNRYLDALKSKDYSTISFHTLAAKYELRKKKKIDNDDFRTYISANVCATMAGIGICGEMNQKLYHSWDHSPSFIGGSMFHGAWNILFQRLSKHPNAFECDESNWDATLHEFLINALRDAMWQFVREQDRTPINRIIWDNLFKDIVFSLIICPNGDLILKLQGNPSGCFLTIVVNTLILYMLFCYSWIRLCPDEELQYNFTAFDNLLSLALCGDDNLGSYSDEIKSWFSTFKVADEWRSLGVIAKKEAQSEGKLINLGFLSQKTLLLSGMYLPYPDHDKVISSLLRHSYGRHHPRWTMLKLYAMRIYSFWNRKTRVLLAQFIAYMERNFMQVLSSPRNESDPMDMFTWEQVKSVYKTDQEITALFINNEGNIVRYDALLKILSVSPQSLKLQPFDQFIHYATSEENWSKEEEDKTFSS